MQVEKHLGPSEARIGKSLHSLGSGGWGSVKSKDLLSSPHLVHTLLAFWFSFPDPTERVDKHPPPKKKHLGSEVKIILSTSPCLVKDDCYPYTLIAHASRATPL